MSTGLDIPLTTLALTNTPNLLYYKSKKEKEKLSLDNKTLDFCLTLKYLTKRPYWVIFIK